MTSQIRQCSDGHRCEYGSKCVENRNLEGSYYCDCGTADGPYVGLYCEYRAETHCKSPEDDTSSWFCTNRGKCVSEGTSNGKSTFSCECPDEYEGKVSSVRLGRGKRGGGDSG